MVKILKKKSLDYKADKAFATQRVISKINILEEEEAASKLAKEVEMLYIDLNIFPISIDDLRIVPEADSERLKAIVFNRTSNNIKVGLVDPRDQNAIDFVDGIAKDKILTVTYFVISNSSFERSMTLYHNAPLVSMIDNFKVSFTEAEWKKFEKDFEDIVKLKEKMKEASTTEVVSMVIGGAIKMKASDVHIEPQEESARLRYRIDGMLQDILDFPLDTFRFLLNRIKMKGKMKINIRNIAQDGHFTIDVNTERVDMRVSTIPGNYGEVIVMRLLNQSSVMVGVEDLGLRGLAYEQLVSQVDRPNGMVLTTGPTGSGKTTTLYALINKINKPDIKIITIEDPIEYQIKGIVQTQVSKGKDYTFAKGLRAIVRQDPDVILVGEIRDDETVDIAINAALTGHLVLSTLHTNSAAATIPRLLELGVKPTLIGPAVNAFIAQRLVRKLCTECKEQYKPAKETINTIKKVLSLISPRAKIEIPKEIEFLYRSKGCPVCRGTGYKGRVGIYEVIAMSENIEKLVLEMAGENEITQVALEEGLVTMTQDGILKSVAGLTTIEEVRRVAGESKFLEEVYKKLMEQSLSYSIQIEEKELIETEKHLSTFEELSTFINSANQKQALRYVLASGLFLEAGDIHIEPEGDHVKIRFRMDGILQTIATIPLNEYPTFLGEIKVLSGLKFEVREGVKDSRFAIELERPYGKLNDTKVDVRVSIILGGYGETVVMRLLNKAAVALDIDTLGIRKKNLERIFNEIKKPNGVFLNTGPTGSGKTTTLYSLLKILNKPEVKVITVEDPIEYQLEGILQTQVNEKEGYTFVSALRALLRQNPDIMMIGEIRDEETAKIATQAALTGHLVLSTIHTNDSTGSIQRLFNMGASPDDLSASVNGFMAQRLVRKLCTCKEKVLPTEEEKQKIEKVLSTISPNAGIEIPKIEYLYKPKGCPRCSNIGYKGRTVVSEVMVADKEIKEMISKNTMVLEIRDKAIENGMITMNQDGHLKVVEGETTLSEVERVTT